MRHHIEHLKTSDIEWVALSVGTSFKMLNHNEDTGERTAIYRIDPSQGASAPSKCHYHSVYEELFILDGQLTFDHKTWLNRHGYIFHPPFAVHGFNSAVPVPTTFISRTPAELDFNFPDAPDVAEPFFIDGKTAIRGVAYINPPIERSWSPMLGPDNAVIGRRLVLNQDPNTGEGSCLLRFNSGVKVPALRREYDMFNEGFVLSGQVYSEDGTVWTDGDYWHRHPNKPVPGLQINQSALVFSSVGRASEI